LDGVVQEVLAVGSIRQSNLGTAWNWICFGILQVDAGGKRWEAPKTKAENKSCAQPLPVR
jgi:hypothetical protein